MLTLSFVFVTENEASSQRPSAELVLKNNPSCVLEAEPKIPPGTVE